MFSGLKNIFNYLPALLLIILAGLSLHFYNEADEWHDKADAATALAQRKQNTIDMMESQRQAVAAIDIKYTKELADAKSENDRLRADIASGTKRLQLNATCSKPVPKTTGPASDPDDASARLTNAAERDYLSLRERIGIATSQINGLQAYITNVCLAK
ncbi:lysis protein [Yersinia enterocolitica]|uniref:lysis protein n=1 Tax=Yersinia enterocolitica TaxID=630 RepID=UPI0021E829EE|nr:lysis protein [Yersinia enterocolitica]EKN3948534.1 lysis protein [Yersinia enterocolitica]EKN6316559.1 lysis protein [Yersinia enterocolitica]ELI8408018.1 lysis protein [Yersinia enterocolitica]UYJ95579.1 lysis protein [Yersinia enterocolitica]HDL7092271.1 lysis protein [Yersinia enterocolitica]